MVVTRFRIVSREDKFPEKNVYERETREIDAMLGFKLWYFGIVNEDLYTLSRNIERQNKDETWSDSRMSFKIFCTIRSIYFTVWIPI